MKAWITSWLKLFEAIVSIATFNYVTVYWSLDFWYWKRPHVKFLKHKERG